MLIEDYINQEAEKRFNELISECQVSGKSLRDIAIERGLLA